MLLKIKILINMGDLVYPNIKFVVCKVFLVLILLLIGTGELFSQNSGRIVGRIIEQGTNEPLVGVNVVIDGTTIGTVTDLDGYYYIQNVQPGTYNLVISMIGFTKTTVRDVIVRLNETTTIDAEIGTQAILGEEVFVFAEREVVRLEVSSSRTLV